MEWMNEISDGIDVRVRAVPRASKNEIQGLYDNALKIRLTTPPVDGKANQALVKFISKKLNLSKSHIQLIQGATSRQKTLRITGLTKEQFLKRIPK